MEIKHTTEILTKDIQDIEKLVGNLNNYPEPPLIELELAMSKLRKIYELLAMISADIRSDLSKVDEQEESTSATVSMDDEIEDMPQTDPREEPEPVQKPTPEEPREPASSTTEEPQEPDPVAATEEPQEPAPAAATEEPQEPAQNSAENAREASILAEKFKADKSINEKNASQSITDNSTGVAGGPIESIKRNIGLNDRFLIIRELMNGDNEGFNQLIQQLDESANFNEAFSIIQSKFPEELEHEGIKILIVLARRKFISA